VIFALAGPLASIGDSAVPDGSGGADLMGSVSAVMSGYYSSEWSEMLLSNLRFLHLKWMLVLYQGKLFSIGAFFLLGVALGKWRVHECIAELDPALRRCVCIAGSFGLVGNFGLAILWSRLEPYPPSLLGLIANLLSSVAVPSLAVAMAAGLALLRVHEILRRPLSLFAAPGRLALTTYLSQTVVGLGLFYGIGFGMCGTISLTARLATALVVFGVQVVAARLWLRSFRYGPIEWAWRCFTYRRWLLLRRQANDQATAAGSLGWSRRD
jgi:uncharacterized membrane protein YeiB